MTLREKLEECINDLLESDKVKLYKAYCESNCYQEPNDMCDFDVVMDGYAPYNIAQYVSNSCDFDPDDDYFEFDECWNEFKTYCDIEDASEWDIDALVEWTYEHSNDYDVYSINEINDLFDEYDGKELDEDNEEEEEE